MAMINIKFKYLEVIFVTFCTFYVIFYLFISVLLLSPIKLATILYIPIFKCLEASEEDTANTLTIHLSHCLSLFSVAIMK